MRSVTRSRPGILLAAVVAAVPLAVAPGVAGVAGVAEAAGPAAGGRTGAPAAAPRPGTAGSYQLTATSTGAGYAPTYTGNGFLGIRVPPAGQGYQGGSVPTTAEVAGYYAQAPGQVQQRASVPTWSTLTLAVGGRAFTPGDGRLAGWRQTLDLTDGLVTTSARWTAPDGRVTDLTYQVGTDRASPYAGVVRLTLRPAWSGRLAVTDRFDGTAATLVAPVAKGWDPAGRTDWETVRTLGTGITAALASRVVVAGGAAGVVDRPVDRGRTRSVGQRLTMSVLAGRRYVVTKYVGVLTGQVAGTPLAAARRTAAAAARAGFARLLAADRQAWAALWAGRIDVLGDPALATEVNASEFYLWSSTRDGVNWSISPAGLSSDGYNGHIFWDAETWMFPALLAQHPDLARGIDTYRWQRLPEAEAHARYTGYRGARYPWESALAGTEQIPPPVSVNSEGLYEIHITADVALAQWQYYLATGDRSWLAGRGWPVLRATAEFWASRVTPVGGGRYVLRHVTGPDEENPDVSREAYTTVAAATALRLATAAAHALGRPAPAAWTAVAAGLSPVTEPGRGIVAEFAGYRGQLVKQADVTMLQYPWGWPLPAAVEQRDLDYYVPRTDPGGPSMSDAINAIDTAALGTPGCSAYVFTQRSVEPFIRDGFDQFSETRTGGAFTFLTGIGGFLQEFLYGYPGLRLGSSAVTVDPMLTGQLGGVVLRSVAWHGSRFSVAVGPARTTVSLQSGPALPVVAAGRRVLVSSGHPLTVPTRRPDLLPTADRARCRPATASAALPGAGALAAVDGSPATGWQPPAVPASLTVPLSGRGPVRTVTLTWGRLWPPAPAPNVPPPAGPVRVLRATGYDLQVSLDGRSWRTVAMVRGRTGGLTDRIVLPPTAAGYLRLRVLSATSWGPPMLEELAASG